MASAQAKSKGKGDPLPTPAPLPSVYEASLRLKGVKGGAFAVSGWSAEVPKLAGLAALVGPGGALRVTKRLDFATAEIMQRAQAGKVSKRGKLVIRRYGKIWLSVTFFGVTLTGVTSVASVDGADVETLTFAYVDADWRDQSAQVHGKGQGGEDSSDDDDDDDDDDDKGGDD